MHLSGLGNRASRRDEIAPLRQRDEMYNDMERNQRQHKPWSKGGAHINSEDYNTDDEDDPWDNRSQKPPKDSNNYPAYKPLASHDPDADGESGDQSDPYRQQPTMPSGDQTNPDSQPARTTGAPLNPGAMTDSTEKSGGLSPGTQHLLIAAGSVAATILFLVLGFVVFRLWKGVPLRKVFVLPRYRRTGGNEGRPASLREPLAPATMPAFPKETDGASQMSTEGLDFFDRGDVNMNSPPPARLPPQSPHPGTPIHINTQLSRSHTVASRAPESPISVLTLPRQTDAGQTASPEMLQHSQQPHDLPLRDLESSSYSDATYIEQTASRRTKPRQKSTFEFPDQLTPQPHRSFLLGPREPANNTTEDSHFSWSTYHNADQAAGGAAARSSSRTSASAATAQQQPRRSDSLSQTGTGGGSPDPQSRLSIATTASSIVQFRTVDSWVQNQSGRLDLGRLSEQEASKEAVPKLPPQYLGMQTMRSGGSPV